MLPCKMDCKIEVMIGLVWPLCHEWNKSMWLVAGYEDWTICVHRMDDGRLLKSLHGHDGAILCMKAHANLLYSGSSDKSVMVHDLELGRRIRTIFGHANSVTGLELLPDHIITSCIDGKIRQFNRTSGSFQRVIASFPQMILSMAGCCKTLYIGCTDGTVQAVSVDPPPESEKLRKLPKSAKKKRNTQKDKQAGDHTVEFHGGSLQADAKKLRKQNAKRLRKQKAAKKKLYVGCNDNTEMAVSVDPPPMPKKLKKLPKNDIKVKRYCRWKGCRCFMMTRGKMAGHLKRTHLKKSTQCLWGECGMLFTRQLNQQKGEHAEDHIVEFYEGSARAEAKKQRREAKRLKRLKAKEKKAVELDQCNH